MTIYGKFEKALVMTKKVVDGKKDPTKKYYSLGVVANNELGEVNCTEDVFNYCEVGKTYDFATQYRTEFDMFTLSGINNVHKGSLFPENDTTSADKK